jgi:hypothetical protein
MVLRVTHKYHYGNGQPRKFFSCSRWPDCNGTHGANPDGSPLGIPGDQATKDARHKAHLIFEEYCRAKKWPKRAWYKFLQRTMGMDAEQAHIGRFSVEQCDELIHRIASLDLEEAERAQ